MCKATGKKWSDCTVMKTEMIEWICEHLNKLKAQKIPVWYICLDQEAKNWKLEKCTGSKDWAILLPLD